MPGYDAKFTQPLLKRHECPICLFAMQNPVQTECGHLFCRECLEPVLRRRRPVCPIDKEEITSEGVFPDNACRREILNLDVYCTFMTSGCTWTGPLKELESHSTDCEFREVQCPQCGQYIQQLILESHKETECPMRPELCRYCGKEVPSQQMEAHLEKVCPEMLHSCPNGCDPTLQMKLPELQHHVADKEGTCPFSEVKCPYLPHGCSFVSQRQNIDKHLQQYAAYHIHLQVEAFTELRTQADKNTAALQHLMERVASLETRANAIERLQDALEQRVEIIDDRRDRQVDRYGGRIQTLEQQSEKLKSTLSQIQKQVEGIASAKATSVTGTSGYGTEAMSGFHSLGGTSSGGGGYGSVTPQRIESLHGKIIEIDHALDRCMSSNLDQELRLQLLERATYDGVLLWKIDDFERRRKEAVEGTTLSLYSTPFYTNRHGYKMCARVYLNGDGLGKNTHLSFFFVIMKGAFDALLQWPFHQKVTLTILNQAGKKHVTDSFRPDPHSSSFQRPGRKEMNIASGCPMFIRLEHLLNGGFVKDDCIFLRVVVDVSDLPTKVSV